MAEPIPVVLPPGFFGNGTPYSANGRYATGDLVRFVNGFAQPVGGWERRTDENDVEIPPLVADPATEAARSGIAWEDNAGSRHMVFGTNLGLYRISATGVVTNITPVGFVPGAKDSQVLAGYGTKAYGASTYGTPRTGEGLVLNQVSSWDFSLFGEVLMAQFRHSGALCQWTPGTAKAVAIATAPVNAQGVLVTSERIVMTIKRQPRLVEWSASESFADWVPAITNTAGSQVLSGQGDLSAIVQVGREILILSTEDAWIGRYIGAPFIYGFEPLGQNCGCQSPNSVTVIGGRAFWYGPGGLWSYDGGVQKVPCEVDDWLKSRAKLSAISKVCAVEQPSYREVWWLFQSVDSTECDSYLSYNHFENHWTYGVIDRTAGIPPGQTTNPVMVGVDGALYNHELVGVKVPAPHVAYVETGPLELGSGGRQMGVQFIFHDEVPRDVQAVEAALPNLRLPKAPTPMTADTNAEVLILGKDWPSPSEPERAYGPYPLDRPSPTTGARGREIRLRYIGLTADWRVGRPRIKVVQMGER
jgi:hypothetical protein